MNRLNLITANCCLLLMLFSVPIFAQVKISGKLRNTQKTPLANANVLLLNYKDSSLVKGTITKETGDFELSLVPAGNYLLLFSMVGYKDEYSETFTLNNADTDMGEYIVDPVGEQLAGVTVTARKPLYEQKIDRMLVNVKSSITNIGGTVLDVLEKSPGVMVNRSSGTLSMSGKTGVMIMINGKMNYLPPEALLDFLQSINASNVERIELINTPPAQYDAAGNAGMINIVLINNPDEGFNGNLDLTLAAGPQKGQFPKANTNFNFRNGPLNLYGSYSFSRQTLRQPLGGERRIITTESDQFTKNESSRDFHRPIHNARIGVDYRFNKKNLIGLLIGGYSIKWSMDALNHSWIYRDQKLDTTIIIDNDELNHWTHSMANLNYQREMRAGEMLTANVDFLHYYDNNPISYLNQYYDADGDFLDTENTASDKDTRINIWVATIDYSRKLNEKTNLQMGLKGAFSKFTNDVLVQKEESNGWVPDPRYTADYYLKEKIGAAYISLDRTIDAKTNIKLGLRFEQTTANLGSNKEKNIVDRNYGRLFPTFYISRKLSEKTGINFSYGRRINRPAFTELAPFLIFIDPKSFITGNPALQPAITDNLKFDFTVNRFSISASFSHTKNAIAIFQPDYDTLNNSVVVAAQNLYLTQDASISGTIPIEVTKWWTSQLNLGIYWQRVKNEFKNGPVDLQQFQFQVNGSESFKLPHKLSFELSGFYSSASYFGASRLSALWRINCALQKKFHEDRMNITLGVDDIFSSFLIEARTSFKDPEISSRFYFRPSYRLYKISYGLKFGNNSLKAKRERVTASEEERDRVTQ